MAATHFKGPLIISAGGLQSLSGGFTGTVAFKTSDNTAFDFFSTDSPATDAAIDAGTTKTTPGTVDKWVKVDINGVVHYIAAYTSKTT